MKYIVFDTETGGLNPRSDALLTAYFCIIENDVLLDSRYYRILPHVGMHISAESLEINKIDIAKHMHNGTSPQESQADLLVFLKQWMGSSKYIPMGWNIHFDYGFIFEQLIPRDLWEKYVSYQTIDVQTLSRFFLNKGSLVTAARILNIDNGTAHDAENDTKTTYKIYAELNKRFKTEYVKDVP